jgi:tetratricopeptide (TPR) repeat protein
LQSEVAREIAREISIQVTPQEQARLVRPRPVNPEAHQAYLKARFYGGGGFERALAIELFETALSLDPNYADAYAGLAVLYSGLGSAETLGIPPAEVMLKAQKAALKALEIDPANVEAHTALGQVDLFYEWDWGAAERRFRRTLELNPNSPEALHWLSHLLLAIGRYDEAMRATLRHFELDPVGRQAYVHRTWHYLQIRQYEDVLEYGREGLKLHPQAQILHDYLARAYSHQGAPELALTHAREAVELSKRNPHHLATLGVVSAAAGKRQEALGVLQELRAVSRQRYVAPFTLALVLAALGEQQQALTGLEQAFAERNSWMLYLKLDPRLDPLRDHSRFQELLRRMKFSE